MSHNKLVACQAILIISAVRYALGRRTYIVSDTVNEVVRLWPELPEETKSIIARDVNDELAREAKVKGSLGMDCDVEQWKRLSTLWISEVSI